MAERVKQIPAKLLEFWNKYTGKQKAVIISVVAVILLAMALLYVTVTKTKYVALYSFSDPKSANELTTLLDEAAIDFRLSKDGTRVEVDRRKFTDATVIMSTNNMPNDGMGWDEAFTNSMSTTEQEKTMKFNLATENMVRRDLIEKFEGIKDAAVNIHAPDADTTIFAENQDASVSVMLTLKDGMEPSASKGLAAYLAGMVGNANTDKITIIDSAGNILFSGGNQTGLGGAVSDANEFRIKLQNQIVQNLKEILLADGFQGVQISQPNIRINLDQSEVLYESYSVPDGMEQGYYKNSYAYKATGTSGSGGIPGTDPNADDTSYMLQNGTSNDSEVTLDKFEYQLNKTTENVKKEAGVVVPDQSSIGVVLNNFVVYDQATMEGDGTLTGMNMTWEQFVTANNMKTAQVVDAHVVPLIAACTGIAENNIMVQLWQQPIFNDKVTKPFQISNYLMIILAVLIIALLIFVVFRGTAPVEVTELEPELSVEQLLATTKENQSLEDIEFSEVSETKRMIDKFVDENPDAVANLLRNWLNEDWG